MAALLRLNEEKLMNWTASLITAGAMTLLAGVAQAHHSRAMFDQNQVLKLSGTVKEFEWTNPHTWVRVVVINQQGMPVDYVLEMASTGQQARIGWTKDSLKPGDKVSIEYNPLKDGSRGGLLTEITLPSGQHLGHGGMPNDPIGK
jgi:hypothetical protein